MPSGALQCVNTDMTVGAARLEAHLDLDSFHEGDFPVFFLPVLGGSRLYGLMIAPVPSIGPNVYKEDWHVPADIRAGRQHPRVHVSSP
jgi:hypothetical protein